MNENRVKRLELAAQQNKAEHNALVLSYTANIEKRGDMILDHVC